MFSAVEISENEVKVVRPPRVQRDDYKIVGDIFAGFKLQIARVAHDT